MKQLATILLVLLLVAMCNVVAAGVFQVLGPLAPDHFLGLLVAGVLAVVSALAFIAGSIPTALKFLRWIGS